MIGLHLYNPFTFFLKIKKPSPTQSVKNIHSGNQKVAIQGIFEVEKKPSLQTLHPIMETTRSSPSYPRISSSLVLWIEKVYIDLLRRYPRADEMDQFFRMFHDGVFTKRDLALSLSRSKEFRMHLLRKWNQQLNILFRASTKYENVFYDKTAKEFRNNDEEALQPWMRLFQTNIKTEMLLARYITFFSLEHVLTSQDFIRLLFSVLFKRVPKKAEVDAWIGMLDSYLTSRFELALHFIESMEYGSRIVREYYLLLLQHEPDKESFQILLQEYQTSGLEKIICDLILKKEYALKAEQVKSPYSLRGKTQT